MSLATQQEHSEQFLTMRELAERWGISWATIKSKRSRGDSLPRSFKIGSRVRYRLSDVEAFEAEHIR